jgi:hypothetical protein
LRGGAAGGWAALIWNERRVGTTAFLAAYERLLRDFATDYLKVDHRQISPEIMGEFFAPHRYATLTFDNRQWFDFAGLRGRLRSSSYAPVAGHPRHDPMLRELARIFEAHHEGGKVVFEYNTLVYVGRLT